MKLKLYAIYDKAVEEFIGPEVSRTHGEAERKFTDNVNNPENGILFSHPEQFTLFHIGDYASETGMLIPNKEGPTSIITAIQVKKTQRPDAKQMKFNGIDENNLHV